jgi:putative ABC transport system permease protein
VATTSTGPIVRKLPGPHVERAARRAARGKTGGTGAAAWLLGLRDLQWRRRRFLVTVLATGLVFALALLMAGVKASFDNEIDRTVTSFHVDSWLVARGSIGPFTAPAGFPAARVEAIRRAPGVRRADPIAVVGATTRTPSTRSVNVVGVVPGGVGAPRGDGSRALARGEAVVDDSLGLSLGDTVELSGRRYRVGALTHGLTYFAGSPTVKLSLGEAQKLRFAGRPLATAVLTQGRPSVVPRDFSAVNNREVATDLERPIREAKQTISLIRSLLWLVAAGIIGAVLYLSVLERTVDFAALKAIGVSTRSLVGALLLQALALALVSVVVAIGMEVAIAPMVAMSVEVPAASYVALTAVALIAGGLTSMVALRRAVRVDPALAFGG